MKRWNGNDPKCEWCDEIDNLTYVSSYSVQYPAWYCEGCFLTAKQMKIDYENDQKKWMTIRPLSKVLQMKEKDVKVILKSCPAEFIRIKEEVKRYDNNLEVWYDHIIHEYHSEKLSLFIQNIPENSLP
jgi:hypothetical protein